MSKFGVSVFRVVILGSLLLGTAPVTANTACAEEPWIEGSTNEKVFPELALPSFAPAIDKLGVAVVNIRTEGRQEPAAGAPGAPGGQEFGGQGANPFEFFFRIPPDKANRRFSSLGSGFVIHPDGYIVTNHHVVENASKIYVSFRDDRRTYNAELVGSDPKTDLALIKVSRGEKLPAAPLGDSDQIKPGDWVMAIGNPFRLGHTATVGIVSAKHRRIPRMSEDRPKTTYDDFIQTDASINPGNSGGPLFNSRGEVIGVNTAIVSPGSAGGFNIGIGFAIPINLAKRVILQLKDGGKVTRGWLGVLIQPVSEDVAEALKLPDVLGALVSDVVPGSPAADAGFQRGDVILTFDGQAVNENEELPLMVADTPVGKAVEVEITRGGKAKKLTVTIRELKDEEPEAKLEPQEDAPTTLGLSVQELTPDIARGFGIDETSGVIATSVDPDSPAGEAGLRRGDVILEVAGKEVNSPNDFRDAVKKSDKGKPVLLLVRRSKNTIFFTIKPE